MFARLSRARRDESGQALVLVLVISFLLLGFLTVAISSSRSSINLSSQYASSTQASAAAQAGINAELQVLRNDVAAAGFNYQTLPCNLSASLSVPGASSKYAVEIDYAPTSSTTCGGTVTASAGALLGGTVPPTSATVISTGSAPHGSATVMQANLSLNVPVPYPSELGQYAIFTSSTTSFSGAPVLQQGSGYPPPSVYSQGTFTCGTGVSTGSGGAQIITYTPVTLSGNCAITGTLISTGAVSMPGGSPHVTGNVYSYFGGVTMAGGSSVTGNVTAAGLASSGNITSSTTIGGAADASGTISGSGSFGSKTANDSSLVSVQPPATVSFPAIESDPSQYTGYTVYNVPNSTYTCAQFFASTSQGDGFRTVIAAISTPTIVYAPTCQSTDSSNAQTYDTAMTAYDSHGTPFLINNNLILWVSSIAFTNTNTFRSTTSTAHDFSIFGNVSPTSTCSPTVDVSFANQTDFNSTLHVFVYSYGAVSYTNDLQAMDGQVFACGGFSGTNSFTLSFDPTAAAQLPWTGVGGQGAVAVTGKFVLRG